MQQDWMARLSVERQASVTRPDIPTAYRMALK
jgi:hypothetical protein